MWQYTVWCVTWRGANQAFARLYTLLQGKEMGLIEVEVSAPFFEGSRTKTLNDLLMKEDIYKTIFPSGVNAIVIEKEELTYMQFEQAMNRKPNEEDRTVANYENNVRSEPTSTAFVPIWDNE